MSDSWKSIPPHIFLAFLLILHHDETMRHALLLELALAASLCASILVNSAFDPHVNDANDAACDDDLLARQDPYVCDWKTKTPIN